LPKKAFEKGYPYLGRFSVQDGFNGFYAISAIHY